MHRVEHLNDNVELCPGGTDRALRRYREFLTPPGRRPLYPKAAECPCFGCSLDDVRYARSVLDEVLGNLPPRPRAELRRLLRPLDAVFLQRTLPDPFEHRQPWNAEVWWYRRLSDRW